jgi:chromate transporter
METIDLPSKSTLFLSFLRLGLTAFGGPAMVAYIRKLAVENKKWISQADFREGVALCQTIPGATAMQTAAYVGYRVGGVAGAAASFIGFGLPAFVLMVVLAAIYLQTRNLPQALSAFNGLRVVIVALVGNAAYSFGRTNLKGWRGGLIAIVIGGAFALEINSLLVIVLAAILGLLLYRSQPFTGTAISSQGKVQFNKAPYFILGGYVLILAGLWVFGRNLFDLTSLMSKIDMMAFGGGFASVPLMNREVVDLHGWLSNPVFLDGIALGQITPGPIVITATFVGYLVNGFIGAVLATIGIFMPSFLIVVGVAPYFTQLRSNANFNRAVEGILASFVGLLFYVTLRFAWQIPWDLPRILIFAGALAALLLKRDVLWVVLGGAIISTIVLSPM